MGKGFRFVSRSDSAGNPGYAARPRSARPRSAQTRRAQKWFKPSDLALWLALGTAAVALSLGVPLRLPQIGSPDAETVAATRFPFCGRPPHSQCVIDGDTFYFRGQSIRIEDIDAPETRRARCASEARLGAQATARLRQLLNAGPFEMTSGWRDEDRYGRKLRTVMRDGRSIGQVLVSEGLARRWTGRREPWCG